MSATTATLTPAARRLIEAATELQAELQQDKANQPARAGYSRDEFCKAHGVSKSFYLKLRRMGLGPDELNLSTGTQRSRPIITVEAAAAWRKKMASRAAMAGSKPFVLSRANQADANWRKVTIRLVNDSAVSVQHVFEVSFQELDKPARDALRDGYGKIGHCIEHDADLLMTVLADWRYVQNEAGEDFPLTRDNLRVMADNFPNATKAILDVLLAEIAKGGSNE